VHELEDSGRRASESRLASRQTICFKNKTLLITGGIGSFGNAVLRRFLKTDIQQIRIFSRDEKKQDHVRLSKNVKRVVVSSNL
jgi:FlaA1/EpsC-like NDP-sugar epimerase